MDNVKIVGTGVYIPKNKVYNDEINEHFSQRGLDASHLMRHMGRRKRYFISRMKMQSACVKMLLMTVWRRITLI